MDALKLIDRYYPEDNELKYILIEHSRRVERKALAIVSAHPEWNVDKEFVSEAALLHDIGIFRTNAPAIHCYGHAPYIQHGLLGAELIRKEGFPAHARVCERHTGTGLYREAILAQQLPLPAKDFIPETLEEQIICFADKFFSKTHIDREKTPEEAARSLAKFGPESVARFEAWMQRFL